ncbi:CPBP family intramembrane glutamic endopeptidase [Negadavirga shengliensis]|uniref:CPBP family intramembrane glutamic endopeptidase n=1 Tax=Negadavirga shengliensis TaxID=1389218 RepID=A0ABV9SWJ7_9BACT
MKYKIIWIGWFTVLGFGLVGLALVWFFQDIEIGELFSRGWPLGWQLLLGVFTGMVASGIAWFLITRSFFDKQRVFYRDMINRWSWTPSTILFVSFCAGVGEELFFRAGLQPLLGLWETSILFVLLHGYLNPFNWRISVYGVVMVFIISCFGYLFERTGIYTAMTAHAVFDWVLLSWMTGRLGKPPVS